MGDAAAMFVVTSEPGAVRLAPLVAEAERYGAALQPITVVAGPDTAALHRTLRLFGLGSAYDLDLGADRYRSADRVIPRAWQALAGFCAEHQVAAVVTAGDDPVAAAALLAAAFAGILGARVLPPREDVPEADDAAARLARALAAAHFCASASDHGALAGQGVDYRRVWVTGNPLADGLADVARQVDPGRVRTALGLQGVGPYALVALARLAVTADLVALGRGLRALASQFEGELVVFAEGERQAQRLLAGMLSGAGGLRLLGRPDYPVLASLVSGAMAVAADSTEVRELARLLGVPFLGLRAGEAGWLLEPPDVALRRLGEALRDPSRLRDLILPRRPLDDGRAAPRILRVLHRLLAQPGAA